MEKYDFSTSEGQGGVYLPKYSFHQHLALLSAIEVGEKSKAVIGSTFSGILREPFICELHENMQNFSSRSFCLRQAGLFSEAAEDGYIHAMYNISLCYSVGEEASSE